MSAFSRSAVCSLGLRGLCFVDTPRNCVIVVETLFVELLLKAFDFCQRSLKPGSLLLEAVSPRLGTFKNNNN